MLIEIVPGHWTFLSKIYMQPLRTSSVLSSSNQKTRHGLASQDKNQTDPSESNEEGQQSKDMPVKSKDDMQQRLGLGLKNMYLNVLEEPLPDDILALLDQLEDDDDADSSRPDVHD
ncbi:MAG: hypothetical protein ACI9TB_001652 [Parasphingorhabdus sp.]|jgi:hypothetical protein|uniref:NepR family anti-sigma factor n=1 Tax=Parasphingorhabdus sp. TaxID=2709688 RepID=UPI0039E46895|tara:strand:+ start:225 stop:572 length:348 start_codon:yes stop_codon:yes gene_type:complete